MTAPAWVPLSLSNTLAGDYVRPALCDDYPWVWNEHGWVIVPGGRVHIPFGMLSDGASGPGIRDLDPEPFFAHDRLYRLPEICRAPHPLNTDDPRRHKRISRIRADVTYGVLLWQRWRVIEAAVRPLGLLAYTWLPWASWARYRAAERRMGRLAWRGYVAACWTLPDAEHWLLPTKRTRDAVYVGAVDA